MKQPYYHRSPRRNARCHAVQAMYAWYYAPGLRYQAVDQFLVHHKMKNTDKAYFRILFSGALDQQVCIDEWLTPFLGRALHDLSPIERAILAVASYELCFCLDVPYRVVINEALEVAKEFGGQDSHKYINGVLDKMAALKRSNELKGS